MVDRAFQSEAQLLEIATTQRVKIFNIKIAPDEKADLVKFMVEGLSSPDYPDHKASELP